MSEEKKPDCVKVAVRMRPLSSKELGNNESSIVDLEESKGADPGSVTINDPEEKEKPAQFAFDIVFGTQCRQEDVYDTVGKPALQSTMTGYNGTIFAYGQTGSGKSWSMMGGPGELRGIIPRVNEQIFVFIDAAMQEVSTRRFLVTCSFFEIYNEIIFDLLNPCQDRSKLGAGLQVKEHPVLGIYVKDLQEIVVDTAEKLTNMMNNGTKNRAVSSTLMNSVSSRSHSIFTIKVHQKDEEDKSKNVFAKLNLVDLAGSERQKGTGASGQTLKEGANINKSLSALGNVINALVENANGKKIFVPFRNSKLTRVLQESLGGNSLCTMLAALSPAACNYEETVGTLRYANRAKAIKVSATKNEEASQISRLNAEIEELKKKLQGAGTGGGGGGSGIHADEEKAEIQQKYQGQLLELQKMVDSNWEEKASLSKKHEAQLNKALEEQKRHFKAMQEESRKRYRLLQDQNDLELCVRSLLDCLQSLPPRADGAASNCSLRSGEAARQWLKAVGSIVEAASGLKQQHTTALVFHGAFSEDLKLWVDGEEAHDNAMARTGARRAAVKVEKLRGETDNLRRLEQQGQNKAKEFAAAVAQARQEWFGGGMDALLAELKEEEGVEAVAPENAAPQGAAPEEKTVPPLQALAVEDVGKILQLVEQQAAARASELNSLAALEIGSAAELVLRGVAHVAGADPQPADAALLRALAGVSSEPGAAPAPAAPVEARPPREQRPLHDWTAEDVDDTVEGTEAVLKEIIPLEGLNKKRTPQELLARPPPKFVHDVGLLVAQATGFLQTLSEEWPEPREGKIDLLQHVADSAAAALGLRSVDFDPADVLKGKEVPKTLKLLQLVAVAGARHKHQPNGGAGGGMGVPAASAEVKAQGVRSAAEVLSALEAITRCFQAVFEKQAARGDPKQESGSASPTRELENSQRDLQEKLEEELQMRRRAEERLGEMQQQVLQERAALQERTAQLDERQRAAADAEGRIVELRRQVETLRSGLLMRAEKAAANSPLAQVRAELESATDQSAKRGDEKGRVQQEVKRLQQQHLEVQKSRETMEQEVKRTKLRQAEGLDGPAGAMNEEIMLLQAEKQKWDVKVAALEDRMRTIGGADDTERQKETALVEEKKLQEAKNDDVQMQLQVIIEERDGLRDGMDMLWQEKTRADEELDYVSNGYTHLSDRLFEKIEEKRELEEKLEQYNNLLKMLQENFEKNRHSPAAQGGSPPASGGSPGGAAPAPAAAAPAAEKAEDAGSSHYSDDDFEEPD